MISLSSLSKLRLGLAWSAAAVVVALAGALLDWRSLQIAGALTALLELSASYANQRVAFGKKIGQFQAVQHNLARLAGETSAALAAAAARWSARTAVLG